ncbi:MAG: hypothetical protein ABSA76_12125, partial [Bacteroidales bacterium]
QFHAMFGVFMVVFYLGFGIFFLFFAKMFNIDRAIKVIMGSTFIFYGIFRITVTYKQIVKAFFTSEDEEE